MNKAAAKKTTTEEKEAQAQREGRLIAFQLMDVTWRVSLPIIILCYVGIKLDAHYHSKPLYTLIGLFSSLALAGILVYKQIKAAYPDFFSKEKPS